MSKKEELIKAINEYFDDPMRGGSGGCNDHHDFQGHVIKIVDNIIPDSYGK